MARRQFYACAVLCLAASCSRNHASLGQLSRAAQPHLLAFSRFETWVGRVLAVADPMASHEAHAETTFSPVRHDAKVLYAKVVSVEGAHQRELHFPQEVELEPIAKKNWQHIAGTNSGTLQAAMATRCPLKAPPWWRDGAGEGPCVLLSNESSLGDQRRLLITVAYQIKDSP